MKLNIPAKVMSVTLTAATGLDPWPFDDGEGDPFWAGGSIPKPFQWELTGTATTQLHGSHLTREPNQYNGLDIFVGDYIAGSSDGIALKIVSVVSKDPLNFTIVVEDEFRYNTFRSTVGNGLFSVPGTAIIFKLNEEGDPVLDPLPLVNTNVAFFANIDSRFDAFRLQDNFPLSKTAHGFSKGDPISIDPITGDFEISDINSFDRLIGTISEPGPGPDQFLLTPTTKIIERFFPPLPGIRGDFIFADPSNPGEYTTQRTGRELFLQLTDAIPSNISGTAVAATVNIGDVITINDIDVTLTGTTISSTVSDINLLTSLHGVTATEINTPTSVTTNISDLAIGAVALFNDAPGPASATINGQLVVFNDGTDGLIEFAQNAALDSDMARVINAAGITGIEASAVGGAASLTITNTTGGSINIVNINNDRDGTPFAGPASGSGLALNTVASTDVVINLSALKGQGIILQNATGTSITDLGLVSVDNGRLPVALVIEQGIRKGDMFVVADIAARDNLLALIGDQAMVLDKGDGDWGMFLFDGAVWFIVSTEESARVDSRTLSVTVDVNSLSTIIIGEVNSGVRVNPVSIEVITPFDGTPIISIGDVGDVSRLMVDASVDLATLGTYVSTPSFQYSDPGDTDILVTFDPGGATVGLAKVTITYS